MRNGDFNLITNASYGKKTHYHFTSVAPNDDGAIR